MLSQELKRVAVKARVLYDNKYRNLLETTRCGAFVCIEPESEDYFIGETFDDAVNQAIDVHPDRLTHTLRIDHEAALHMGAILK